MANASLDFLDEKLASKSSSMYFPNIDRFNEWSISAFVTPSYILFIFFFNYLWQRPAFFWSGPFSRELLETLEHIFFDIFTLKFLIKCFSNGSLRVSLRILSGNYLFEKKLFLTNLETFEIYRFTWHKKRRWY